LLQHVTNVYITTRNHGHDVGRVLAGIQVPPEDREAFQSSLDSLGYPYVDESNNPVYIHFLK
jgi:threonine dehydratase